jgi:hypothetical protein
MSGCVNRLEDLEIPLEPKIPCHDNEKGVKGLAPDLGHILPRLKPPVHKPVLHAWREVMQIASPQELEPHFTAKDA